MMKDDENKFGDDSFWDIKPKNDQNQAPGGKTSTFVNISVTVEDDKIEIEKRTRGGTEYSSGTITRYVSPVPKKPNTDRKLILEYEPENPLVKKVQVYTDNNEDSVFATDNLFMRERRALLGRTYKETPYVPFFAMPPRYSQMTRSQLGYYLWWRENVRHGVWLQSGPSYVQLYAHELICSMDEDKNEILSRLCEIYLMQATDASSYSMGLESVICDFCIINNLSLPADKLGDKLQRFLSAANLPEFFTDISDRKNPEMHKKIIAATSMYNYKKSKHYIGNEELFEAHMQGVIAHIFKDDSSYAALSAFTNSGGNVFSSYKPFFKMSGITAKNAKVKIDYYPLTFLRAPITDAMRYTENKIREHLGIKSKLNVTTLNPDIRRAVDEYAVLYCPPMSKHKKMLEEERLREEEYDRLYDIPHTPLSIENAKEIEEESWQTTQILVEAFEDSTPEGHRPADAILGAEENEKEPVFSAPYIQDETQSAEALSTLGEAQSTEALSTSDEGSSGLLDAFKNVLGDVFSFLEACIKKDFFAQRKYCSEHATTADEAAEQINEAALDIVGDIILEEGDGGYEILDDYKNLFC